MHRKGKNRRSIGGRHPSVAHIPVGPAGQPLARFRSLTNGVSSGSGPEKFLLTRNSLRKNSWLRMAVAHEALCLCGKLKRESVINVRIGNWTAALLFLAAACLGGPGRRAEGQLRWSYPPPKAPLRVRLVALALSLPRSSYFKSYEVFVAETEIGQEEWTPIKLIFYFLPYEPKLSESGFDYSLVHEVSALRDEKCDQTVEQLTERSLPHRHEPLVYSRNVPRKDLDRRRITLPCYETSAYEYIKSRYEPVAPPPNPHGPVLNPSPHP